MHFSGTTQKSENPFFLAVVSIHNLRGVKESMVMKGFEDQALKVCIKQNSYQTFSLTLWNCAFNKEEESFADIHCITCKQHRFKISSVDCEHKTCNAERDCKLLHF